VKSGGLRGDMPLIAAFIDDMREAFGRDKIDSAIRNGMRGGDLFFASENGITIGRRPNTPEGETCRSM